MPRSAASDLVLHSFANVPLFDVRHKWLRHCITREDSDRPARLSSLIRGCIICNYNVQTLNIYVQYSMSEQ